MSYTTPAEILEIYGPEIAKITRRADSFDTWMNVVHVTDVAKMKERLDRENAAMCAFVEMVALDRDDRASPGLKRQASLMLQDLAADNFNPDKPR